MAKKLKPQKPDETLSMGPLAMARFGKSVIYKPNWPEGKFDKVQKRLVKDYPKIVEDINMLVTEIADLIKVLSPEKLLHRAWWEMAAAHIKIETEAEMGEKEATAMRMIDYVQSVIAAISPAENQRDDVTDEEWTDLRSKIQQLFSKVTFEYQLCRNAKNKTDDPNFDQNFEDFQVQAQLCWCNVRGRRYPVHESAYIEDMLLPHSSVLQELFGISGEQFVMEIKKIWHVLSLGIQDLSDDLKQLQNDTMDAIAKKVEGLSPDSMPNPSDLSAEVIKENAWEDRHDDIRGRLSGMDLFDVQKITDLPDELLAELSWGQGEEKDFFAEGEFRGWPLRIWPVFKRPFIQLGDRFYCFDLHSLFDNIYRVMQRIILRLKSDYQETWNTIQRSQSEDLPLKYLKRLLPGAKALKNVFYRGKTDSGATEWCEADGLLIYDDHLFVIEARGGAFTYTPPSSDFPAYINSLKNLVLKPAMQGRRFLDYLKTAERVQLFDSNHNQIDKLRKSDFRHITICPVTLDPFTELAAQIQHLRKIGVNVGVAPVWAISLDDLRVYADIFENPLVFLHYVEQRMQAFDSDVIQCNDELDHLGLYLEHNHYSTYAKKVQNESNAPIDFFGYRSEVDKFFHERMFDSNALCSLKQNIPARVLEIIEVLSQNNKPGRTAVAAYILDIGGDWRNKIDTAIVKELARQPTTKRCQPFSTIGDVKLTISCWTEHLGPRNAAWALNHAQTLVVMNNESRRLLIELSYSATGELQDIDWKWIDRDSIPPEKLSKLHLQAEGLRQERLSNAKTERRKIGRNECCPCGSGRKYKKCCLDR